ncbi:basic salivary proline-rich protein 2-like [Sagmatias obliquidens]|uniref:basic salivary proline-rich protein 2-like n=1 Tax=Sagmatias obliquidens TaxID=3371155 RepID=UPI000F43FEC2|nr:basic salivary proline-rich protein 2-like [Lagenorhynchus obliquidens]
MWQGTWQSQSKGAPAGVTWTHKKAEGPKRLKAPEEGGNPESEMTEASALLQGSFQGAHGDGGAEGSTRLRSAPEDGVCHPSYGHQVKGAPHRHRCTQRPVPPTPLPSPPPRGEQCRGRVWWPREVPTSPAGLPFRPPPCGAASPRVPLARFPRRAKPARGAGRAGAPRGLPPQEHSGAEPPGRKTPPCSARCLRRSVRVPRGQHAQGRPRGGSGPARGPTAAIRNEWPAHGRSRPPPGPRSPQSGPAAPSSPEPTARRPLGLHFAKCPAELAQALSRAPGRAEARRHGRGPRRAPGAPWRLRRCTSRAGSEVGAAEPRSSEGREGPSGPARARHRGCGDAAGSGQPGDPGDRAPSPSTAARASAAAREPRAARGAARPHSPPAPRAPRRSPRWRMRTSSQNGSGGCRRPARAQRSAARRRSPHP